MEVNSTSNGYLIVRVTTARGAIPLEDALVSIRGGTAETSGVIRTLKTDSDGKTPRVSLPTPELSLSGAPGEVKPYATYNVDVFKEGFIPAFFHSVPVFPTVLSIQPAVLAPIPESTPYDSSERREDTVIEDNYLSTERREI